MRSVRLPPHASRFSLTGKRPALLAQAECDEGRLVASGRAEYGYLIDGRLRF